MRKFVIAAALLLASAVPALASPFSDFAGRVAEIRQAKNLPPVQVVENKEALEYLRELRDHQDGHAISNYRWRVTRWAKLAYGCGSGTALPTSAASRADAIYWAELQQPCWPRTGLFELASRKVWLAILPTQNGWLIATQR